MTTVVFKEKFPSPQRISFYNIAIGEHFAHQTVLYRKVSQIAATTALGITEIHFKEHHIVDQVDVRLEWSYKF